MYRKGLWKAMFCFIFMICLFPACASGRKDTVIDAARMEAIGDEFLKELNEIIYLREKDEALLELDALVVTGNKTYHLSRLDTFYQDYRVGSDTELLIIFQTTSFVVCKLVYEGTAGYYYRYELNPVQEAAINISGQAIDKVEISEESVDDLRRVTVTLKKDKAHDIVFTFRNIVSEDEEAA